MIYLRELTEKDIDVINTWRNDLELIEFLGANFRYINIETDREWFNSYMRNRSSQVRCSICLKDSNALIGLVSLTSIDNLNKQAEFHIMIGNNEYQNKGYGKIAINEMLKHSFNNLNLNRIYLHVLSSNVRAINAYKQNGFVEEGNLRQAVYKSGNYRDLVIMSILKSEYEALNIKRESL